MPTVWSVSTVGYVQIDSRPEEPLSERAVLQTTEEGHPPSFLHVVFWARDVVVQTRAVRTDRVEERNAFRAVLHGMADEADRIAELVAGAGPALTRS